MPSVLPMMAASATAMHGYGGYGGYMDPAQFGGGYGMTQNSNSVDQALARHPELRAQLDESCVQRLREAQPERALEIIYDVGSGSMEIRNPSAFIMKALVNFPTRRGAQNVDSILARRPALKAALDEGALQKLREADPERAVEVIEDVASKPDIRNPSAFIANSLAKFPHKRGASAMGGSAMGGMSNHQLASAVRAIGGNYDPFPPLPAGGGTVVDWALAKYPRLRLVLDETALQKLRGADPGRAEEILEDVGTQINIRNPSAFVVKALAEHSERRGPGGGGKRAKTGFECLDEAARTSLQNADEERAAEIMEELNSRVDIRNPSAFVARALQQYPLARGRNQ